MTMLLSHITVNRVGNYKVATLHGRQHYVVPAAMIVPGVLEGSKGALLYEDAEIALNVDAWNGMPLVCTHPMKGGVAVSARSPEILNEYSIGVVLNAKINRNKKLIAEAWFDVEKTRQVEPRIIETLERGEKLELSTGLFTKNVPVSNGSTYNGTPYTHVARNLRPDHLAVLPDAVGACSLKDGCGIGVVNAAAKKKGICPDCKKPMKDCTCKDMTGNAQSFSEISLSVDKAIRETYGVTYIYEYYSDCVIFRLGERLLKVDYSVDKKTGKVNLSDTAPTEVLKSVTYKPVLNHDSLNAARQVLANWSPAARKAAALARKGGRGLKSRAMGAVHKLLSKFKRTAGGDKKLKKPMKAAKDKSGEQKAGLARSKARQAKLQAKLKAHRDAKRKKTESSKKKSKVSTGKGKPPAKKAASKKPTVKKAASKKPAVKKVASKKSAVKKVASKKPVKSSKSSKPVKKAGKKTQKKLTQKDVNKQRKKNAALKAKAKAGRDNINKMKEKLRLIRKINKVNAATDKKWKAWGIE